MDYTISYLGKQYNTTIHKDLTDEEFRRIQEEYYAKPDIEKVRKQMLKIEGGGQKTNLIYDYYIKDIAAKTRIHYCKWSIEEALQYKPLMEFFAGKSDKNKKVFPDTMSLTKKIETAFRLCGFGTAAKPSNFPIKAVDSILEQYNVNGNYYDYSCGWGTRLLSSLRNHVNYFGTDPNYLLCQRLIEMGDEYKRTCSNDTQFDIRVHGSEILVPEWINTIGLAFSSPPYFNLEDYKIGDQSYKEGVTYSDWLTGYLMPTFININKYLLNNGYFALNINNFNNYNDYDLVGDSIRIAESNGFVIHDVHVLKNITRCSGHKGWNEACMHDNNEKIIVFRKEKNIE